MANQSVAAGVLLYQRDVEPLEVAPPTLQPAVGRPVREALEQFMRRNRISTPIIRRS